MIIKIKNLKLKTIIGIHKWEEIVDREIIINATISTNFDKSLFSDDIADTIDYDAIVANIKNLVSTKRFKLVEKMAQEIMDLIMLDQRISKCKLEIDKIGAVESLESFSIIIEQKRTNGR